MTIATKATKSLDMLSTALHGLDTIGELAKSVGLPGAATATEILVLVTNVVDKIREGFEGEVDANAINQELLKLRATLLTNDAAADSELDKKFPR